MHWFEIGEGSRWVRIAGLAAGVLLLSWFVGYKLFRGPLTEVTMAQAVVGRQVAEGRGFTTLVNHPQSFAWARERISRGKFVDVRKPLPELHQPPLYSAAIAAAHRLLPARWFNGDTTLLALNIVLLWCVAMQSFFLARNLFGEMGGVIALLGVMLSAPIWAATVAVNGAVLTMALWLALFQLTWSAETRVMKAGGGAALTLGRRITMSLWRPALTGMILGALFLSDYTTIVAAPLVAVVILTKVSDWRVFRSLVLITAAFVVVAGPWMARNVSLTGSPVGFAARELALKAGDPTAEPATRRAMFTTESPAVDFKKLGNKALTSLQRGAGERFWSGGGIFFAAFFAAGFAYRFRDARANRLRWFAVAVIASVALAQAFLSSGEGERDVWLCMAPLVIVFGTGFFLVLVKSSEALESRVLAAALVLLALQAVPLARDVLEPRGTRYNYPPYLPALFSGIGQKLSENRAEPPAWMSDVPAGASWYSGQRVWAQPATMKGFHEVARWQRVRALVLTPATLARPFFGEIANEQSHGRGDWAPVYRGLAAGRLPADFPLVVPVRIAPDFYVLIDPGAPKVAAEGAHEK